MAKRSRLRIRVVSHARRRRMGALRSAIGPGSGPGAGPGWKTNPGALRHSITAAGPWSAEAGAGCRVPWWCGPCTRRLWSYSSAARVRMSLSIGGGGGGVAWFPLGPREVYVPPYRASERYVQRVNVTNTTVNVVNVTNVYNNLNVTKIKLYAPAQCDRRDGCFSRYIRQRAACGSIEHSRQCPADASRTGAAQLQHGACATQHSGCIGSRNLQAASGDDVNVKSWSRKRPLLREPRLSITTRNK